MENKKAIIIETFKAMGMYHKENADGSIYVEDYQSENGWLLKVNENNEIVVVNHY